MQPLRIQSHKGPYTVEFDGHALARLSDSPPSGMHFVVDSRVAELYAVEMRGILAAPSVLRIQATEGSKSLARFPDYVEHLVQCGVRRGHVLVAIGGGVIQDITCFLAATLLRGLDWQFLPTTLLAQADSCIGSKSSINNGRAKNILGTFTPPKHITIITKFLETLPIIDIRSGIGEMLKVHAIDGPASFDQIARDYEAIVGNRNALLHYLRRSLEIKKTYVEQDEFDQGPRLVFNYGHSFGHAIEAASDFAVPHGIAVTIGMDMANWISAKLGVGVPEHFLRMHPALRTNYLGFEETSVPLAEFLAALGKDKKNTGAGTVTLVLPDKEGHVFRAGYPSNAQFQELCAEYLFDVRRAA